ncbi:MAG: hypothetical protein QOF57_2651 [Frankiaceae bacterium]|nr:hypothetical protein [Frankiaceae bacterium]
MAAVTEQWRTTDDLHAARERITAGIAGWVPPAAHGTVLVTPDGTASLLAANAGAPLSAAVLARVVGYASGTHTLELTVDQVRRAVADLAPAEAATHVQHPNLAAWRTLVGAFEFDPACRAYAVFVQDLADETSSRYDEMLRATLAAEQPAESELLATPPAPGAVPTAEPGAATLVAIRPAVVADAPAVLAFWALAAEDSHRPPDDRQVVELLIAHDPAALLLATLDGDIVGSVVAGWDGWRAHLYRLAVHPAHRRRGLGSTLLRAAEQRLAALGARRFDAMVLDDNVEAQGLWDLAGYAPQAEWRRWVKAAPAGD